MAVNEANQNASGAAVAFERTKSSAGSLRMEEVLGSQDRPIGQVNGLARLQRREQGHGCPDAIRLAEPRGVRLQDRFNLLDHDPPGRVVFGQDEPDRFDSVLKGRRRHRYPIGMADPPDARLHHDILPWCFVGMTDRRAIAAIDDTSGVQLVDSELVPQTRLRDVQHRTNKRPKTWHVVRCKGAHRQRTDIK